MLDGTTGRLVGAPSEEERTEFTARLSAARREDERRRALVDLPGATADGCAVSLWANIGRVEETAGALAQAAEMCQLARLS